MDAPAYDEIKEMGRRVIEALGITTAATHMEWFFGPKGLKFSEIGCRPPGVGPVGQLLRQRRVRPLPRMGAGRLPAHDRPSRRPRRYACGIIALRPDRDGIISHYDGADEIWRKYGGLVVGSHFPSRARPTQAVAAGYMANAWMRVRHEDYDTLRGILNEIGETVQVRAR